MNNKISEPLIVKTVALAPFLRNLDSPSEEGGEADSEAVITALAIASVVSGDVREFHFCFPFVYALIIANLFRLSRESFVKFGQKIKITAENRRLSLFRYSLQESLEFLLDSLCRLTLPGARVAEEVGHDGAGIVKPVAVGNLVKGEHRVQIWNSGIVHLHPVGTDVTGNFTDGAHSFVSFLFRLRFYYTKSLSIVKS